MATKAERYRSQAQRTGRARPPTADKLKKGRRRSPAGPALLREGGDAAQPPHNYRAGDKNEEAYDYEVAAGRPSRKPTRTSAAHVKSGVGKQIQQVNRVHSPAERASRGKRGRG